MSFNPDDYLGALTKAADAEIDIGKAALALAARDQPGVVLERYVHHLHKLGEDVGKYHKELIAAGALDDAATQLAALKHVIVTINNYTGDIETHEDMQNANLLRVIDRRKGMSVTLSVIYLAVAGAQGWEIYGLDFPGHFLCRIDKGWKAPDFRSVLRMQSSGSAGSSQLRETGARRECRIVGELFRARRKTRHPDAVAEQH
jgi:hypothetical protein